MSYDDWLEAPYQRDDEPGECPECNEHAVTGDKMGVECSECGWSDEPDFEAMAEAKAEARAEARYYGDDY